MINVLDTIIDLLWSQVGKGIYVYGGNGEDLTAMTEEKRDSYMRKRETETKDSNTGKVKYTKEQNIARCKALYEKRVKAGVNPILAFDCSGLQYWAGKKAGFLSSDMSANGFYNKCMKVNKADVKRGDYCFAYNGKKATHIGMYVGDDIIIECQGRDVGVVTNKLSKTTVFNAFGRYPGMESKEDTSNKPVIVVPDPIEPVNPPSPKPDPLKQKYVVINGKMRIQNGVKKPDIRVHIRDGNGTSYNILKTAYSGERYPYVLQEDADPHWYKIEYNGGYAWISSNSRYTSVTPVE